MTVEALAKAISQIDDIEPEFATMIATGLLPFIERHIAAGQQGAGCGACGDGCKDRGSCRLADESPKPAGAVPQVVAWHAEKTGRSSFSGKTETRTGVSKEYPQAAADEGFTVRPLVFGDAREAAARGDPLDAAIAKGTKAWAGVPDSFVEDLRGEAAGRADAVPADEGRHDFERWAKGAAKRWGLNLKRWDDSGEYAAQLTRDWWKCWTESRKSMLAAPIPQQPAAEGGCPKCGKVGVICKTPDCAMLTRPPAEGTGRDAVAWLDKGGGIAVVGTNADAWRALPDGFHDLYTHPSPVADAEAPKARPRVFIDMDGVIVDFDAYKTANGLTGDEVKRTPGAYLAMPAIPGAIKAVRSVIGMGFEVWIATKPPTGVPYAYSDKAAWVMEHLPELKRRIIVTHDKGLLGAAGDFLCDDRPHKANCERFAGTLLRFVDGYHWPQALDFLRARRLKGPQP